MNRHKNMVPAVILVFFMIISIGVLIYLSSNEKGSENENKEVTYERSIFYGLEPNEVANIIGIAARNTTYESSRIEHSCGGRIHMDYDLGNDDHLNICYSQYGDDEYYYRELYFAKSGYEDNEGDWNEEYAIGHMMEVYHRLLDPFNISEISDLKIEIIPWGHDFASWRVTIVQMNEGFEVDGTGLDAHVSRENGEIRTMTIKDWIFPDHEFDIAISIEEGGDLTYSELEAVGFNLSYRAETIVNDPITGEDITAIGHQHKIFNITRNDVLYIGPSLFDGHFCYRYKIELMDNSTCLSDHTFILNAETGLVLKWESGTDSGSMSRTFFGNLIGEEIRWSDPIYEN